MSKRFPLLLWPMGVALLTIMGWLVATAPTYAADIIVNPGDSIQEAIDEAFPGDNILIMAGHYTESFTVDKAVSLIGEGAETTILHAEPNDRIMTASVTIASSMVISGLTFTDGDLISMTANCPDGCGGAIYLFDNARPTLQNLVFTHNQAAEDGGALFVEGASTLILNQVTFSYNMADAGRGGAIYSIGGVQLTDSSFVSNTASVNGGAVYVLESSTIEDTTFEDNHALEADGGAIYADQRLEISGSTFMSNSAFLSGGAIYGADVEITTSEFMYNQVITGSGGALYTSDAGLVMDTIFSHNSAQENGGAAYTNGAVEFDQVEFTENWVISRSGGAIYSNLPITIENSHFMSNTAELDGGATYLRGQTPTIIGSEFMYNTAGDDGGAIYAENGAWITTTTIMSNTANDIGGGAFMGGGQLSQSTITGNESFSGRGGGVYASNHFTATQNSFIGNIAGNNGGGLYLSGYGRVDNSLFAGNRVPNNGEAIYVGGTVSDTIAIANVTIANPTNVSGVAIYINNSNATITNTIITRHSTGIQEAGESTVTADYNLYFTVPLTHTGSITSGENLIIGEDPLFIDPAAGNYDLQSTSPAVDAGQDLAWYDYDILGHIRPGRNTPAFDIGAYEFQGPAFLYLPLINRN